MNKITTKQAAELLKQAQDIVILCHKSPDGDTMGSGFGLYHILKQMNKRVRVECEDPFLEKFSFLFCDHDGQEFAPKFVVAVDVADEKLLGKSIREKYTQIDLCMDHHPSNTQYADRLLLEPGSASTCEVVEQVVEAMGETVNARAASCFYTGMATDTGCFKFSNTTPRTHILAAKMMECGADYADINQILFDTKKKNKLVFERLALDALEYDCEDRVALLAVTAKMMEQSGVEYEEIDDIASLPRQIEGVVIGVTIKEKGQEDFKISVRTQAPYDASAICAQLGGGGHARAAGCAVKGDLSFVKGQILMAVKQYLK